MNIHGVENAIRVRILADTGSGGIFNAGTPLAKSVYSERGPRASGDEPLSTALFPFLIIASTDGDNEDGLDTDTINHRFAVHVFDVIEAGNATSLAILDRLYGDGIAQSNRQATYGLHRWSPTLTITGDAAAPWAAPQSACRWTGYQSAHDDFAWHWVEFFQMTISRVRV